MYGDMGPGEEDMHSSNGNHMRNGLDENDEAFYCEAPKFGTASAFKENPCYEGEDGDTQPTYADAGYLDMEPNAQPAAAEAYGKI